MPHLISEKYTVQWGFVFLLSITQTVYPTPTRQSPRFTQFKQTSTSKKGILPNEIFLFK